MIIRPDVVEQVDLTDPAESRRWRWTFVGDDEAPQVGGKPVDEEWKMEELWP